MRQGRAGLPPLPHPEKIIAETEETRNVYIMNGVEVVRRIK